MVSNLHNRLNMPKALILVLISLSLALASIYGCTPSDPKSYLDRTGTEHAPSPPTGQEAETQVEVVNLRRSEEPRQDVIYRGAIRRVVDGDSLHIYFDTYSNYYQRTRLIGIDAPEMEGPTHQNGQAAQEHMAKILEDRDFIYVTIDSEAYDDYERLLIYVWETPEQAAAADPHDGLINMQMVSDGYAESLPRTPNTSFAREYYDAEEVSEGSGVGLWEFGDFTKSDRKTDPVPMSSGHYS